MKVAAVVQARMGSTRLPGKTLELINGKPMIQVLVERLKKSKMLDSIVIATTTKEEDKPILRLGKRLGVGTFAGSESDVLDRHVKAAKKVKAQIIVRVPADNPLVDPHYLDELIKLHIGNNADYSFSESREGLINGMGAEVINFSTLQNIAKLSKNKSEREHVTLYIIKNPENFNVKSLKVSLRRPNYRVTVDTKDDLKLVREIFRRLPDPTFEEVVRLLDSNPNLANINSHVKQKLGGLLIKSV